MSTRTPAERKPSAKRKRDEPPPPPITRPRPTPSLLSVQSTFLVPAPRERFDQLGGLDSVKPHIRQLIEWPLVAAERFARLGVVPPRGILLFGPPGSGKSHLARAIAGELGVALFSVAAPEFAGALSGDGEKKMRQLFAAAREAAPSIILLDDLDAIASNRQHSSTSSERRIVTQLICCLDEIARNDDGCNVVVIGATSNVSAIDPSLRRMGRFDREIGLQVPDLEARTQILQIHLDKLKLKASDISARQLAERTPGYVGADIAALVTEAAMVAIERSDTDNQPAVVRNADFDVALQRVQPTAMREGFALPSSTLWHDVGALSTAKEELYASVVHPIRFPNACQRLGITAPSGALLYGPPGCGKTLLAKALANEVQANFISVKGPELLSKYVGDSEQAVRQVFERARFSMPCIIFFDEIDSICPRRESGSNNAAAERVVNQLLVEMDGMSSRGQVFVLGATNRPDMIDPAMLRPGRLDKRVFVPLPTEPERVDILRTLTRKVSLHSKVSVESLASLCTRFSGADLAALVKEASLECLRHYVSTNQADIDAGSSKPLVVTTKNFKAALKKVRASTSLEDESRYDQLRAAME